MTDADREESPMQFTTHTKEAVEGERLQRALDKVAGDWASLARRIREEDGYASHVSEAEKDGDMQTMLSHAERIRAGEVGSFTIWQRVNAELTGECVPLFSK